MSQDLFDFGFTAVDENELEAVQKEQEKAATIGETAKSNQKQLDDLYNAIVPLLNNLKKNPQKEYILWPNSCLLYTSPSPRDQRGSRMPSWA